jgi:hypothetical protein
MRKLFVPATVVFMMGAAYAQPLYTPLEFQEAYKKGTRKPDGTVAPGYWQNRSEYKIKAKVDPYTKVLTGEARITYYHNGPDTIRNPTFHTYHDYYRPDSKKSGFFGSGQGVPKTDGVTITKLVVDQQEVDVANEEQLVFNGTNYIIRLTKPLVPKGKLSLQINWKYTIPGKGFERSGAIDSTSMFIAYWYPEMAVLDDIDGWDRVIYDAATEFYHDYSDYEVEIETQDNFIVWASVAPANETEVYSPAIRERLAKARKSTTAVPIYTEKDFKKPSGKTLTWKYSAKEFPDFSFALSDHFLWDAALYKDAMGEYFTHVAYQPQNKFFSSVIKAIGESLRIFHTEFPVYPFPYKYFTIFNGLEGGGMEFPGMANDEAISAAQMEQWTGIKMDDYTANLGLTLHEMCHMYFPFLMGVNEKKYAWMDEGMASFTDYFTPPLFPEGSFDQPYLGSQNVLPIMAPSHLFQGSGLNSYTIGSKSYEALYALLGKETFTRCMKVYMDEWKHKHPTPYDFMYTFNRVSGKDLNWFWNAWYFQWGYMDMGIRSFTNNELTIENPGGRPMAFSVVYEYEDGTTSSEAINPEVWKGTTTFTKKVTGTKNVKSIRLKISDALASNNQWPAK